MTIPTSNVVIGFDKETMNRLFIGGATYESLIKEIVGNNSDEVLLFGGEANPNLLSFKHSFGVGTDQKMLLEFIDPKNEFEKRFFSDSLVRNIAGYGYSSDEGQGDLITEYTNKDQAQPEYAAEFAEEFKKEYLDRFGEKVFYIAYGSGNNLDLWAGPHRMVLTGANIDIKGGKKITLTLIPSPQSITSSNRKGVYNEKVNLNLAGLTLLVEGRSRNINFAGLVEENKYNTYNPFDDFDKDQQIKGLDVYLPTIKAISSRIDRNIDSIVGSSQGSFDFHSLVVDTLRSYIQKATGNRNVVVLLPNLNLVCRQAIEAARLEARVYYDTFEKQSDAVGSVPMFGNFLKATVANNYALKQTRAGEQHAFIRSILSQVGIRLASYNNEDPVFKAGILSPAAVSMFMAAEKAKTFTDRVDDYFTKSTFYASLDIKDTTGIPKHEKIVHKVIDSIKKLSKSEYPFHFVMFTETQQSILDVWSKEEAKFPLFAGYKKFTNTREAIIVGDSAMIRDYLYGSALIKDRDKEVAKIRRESKKASKKDNSFISEENSPSPDLVAELSIPLHPTDRVVIGVPSYTEKIREIIFTSKGTGSFGDPSYLPDDFAFGIGEFSKEALTRVRRQNIPVFRYNTEAPNVIDMKFNFAPIYLAQLKMGFQKEIMKKASATVEGALPAGIGSLPIKTRGAGIAFLKLKQYSMGLGNDDSISILKELAGRLSPELLAELKTTNPDKGADAIASLLNSTTKNDIKATLLVDQLLPGNPQNILTELSEDMYRNALQIDITTLPTFHISTVSTLGQLCLLFAQDTPILMGNKPIRSLMNSFFSGVYKIMGWTHKITATGASSEFRLVKNFPNNKTKKQVEEEEDE